MKAPNLLRDRSSSRWLALFVIARALATLVAVGLLLVHHVTHDDALLAAFALAYGAVSIAAAAGLRDSPAASAAWTLDVAIALGLVLAGGNWRSPFYLLVLTTLTLPATTLPTRRALGFITATAVGYAGVALLTGVDWSTLETSARLESFASHLLLPMLVGTALAYSAELLRRLEAERARSERLALDAERRRLARELHDSAKQRIHAAHLVLSSLDPNWGTPEYDSRRHAMRELEAATAEMEASLTDLRTAAGGGMLLEALRRRPARLAAMAGVRVHVDGTDLGLASPLATHVYHVLTEAILNAARHAGAGSVRARLRRVDGRLVATVVDDGQGLPSATRLDSQGMRSMSERAELLGGCLRIAPAEDGRGTSVTLDVPLAEGSA
jgi:signal transduction histidine kinase